MNFILPKLYSTNSKGKIKEWAIKVYDLENNTALIETIFGQKGEKLQKTEEIISEGKNIGKSNETSPYQQAVNEAQSKWTKKKDKNYSEFYTSTTKRHILPMLAVKYMERKHNISYPCFVQPKLNGVRCLAKKISETEIEYTSRTGKEWKFFSHLTPNLLNFMSIGEIWDGEIFNPEYTFQFITSLVKKEKPETISLQYWVYDKIDDSDFSKRYDELATKIQFNDKIVLVPTFSVRSEEEVIKYHSNFINHKYEGTMIRNEKGGYTCDYRSPNLQKLKNIAIKGNKMAEDSGAMEEEFKIIGGKKGKGKFKGCCIFLCQVGNNVFSVTSPGSIEEKRSYFDNLNSYLGKMLTVKFEDYSSDGIPIKPIAIAVRDYE